MAVVLRMAKGHKPNRPASDTLQDSHWNLIQQCWSSTEKRPAAEAIILSIQQFLNDCPPPLPLRDILVSRLTRSGSLLDQTTEFSFTQADDLEGLGIVTDATDKHDQKRCVRMHGRF